MQRFRCPGNAAQTASGLKIPQLLQFHPAKPPKYKDFFYNIKIIDRNQEKLYLTIKAGVHTIKTIEMSKTRLPYRS